MPQIVISETKTCELPSPHTEYIIQVRHEVRSIKTSHRYSDFVKLANELEQYTGKKLPVKVPSKGLFVRTVNSSSATEKRRNDLEIFLQTINNSSDSCWRNSPVWRKFLNISSSTISSSNSNTDTKNANIDPVIWLNTYREMKSLLQDSRRLLVEKTTNKSTNKFGNQGLINDNGITILAKKNLVQVGKLLSTLKEGLAYVEKNINDNDAKYKSDSLLLGHGELRRRKELVSSAERDKVSLDSLVYGMASDELGNASANIKTNSNTGLSTNLNNKKNTVGHTNRRVFGPIKETPQTRSLDNNGLLQLQKEQISNQDDQLEQLHSIIAKQKQLGLEINSELDTHHSLLDDLQQGQEHFDSKLKFANRKLDRVS